MPLIFMRMLSRWRNRIKPLLVKAAERSQVDRDSGWQLLERSWGLRVCLFLMSRPALLMVDQNP